MGYQKSSNESNLDFIENQIQKRGQAEKMNNSAILKIRKNHQPRRSITYNYDFKYNSKNDTKKSNKKISDSQMLNQKQDRYYLPSIDIKVAKRNHMFLSQLSYTGNRKEREIEKKKILFFYSLPHLK